MNYAAGWALGASVTIMALGLSIIAPALPLFGRAFGVGAALVGSLVSVYALGRLALDVPAGYLVDRVGRRPVLLASAAVVALAATLAGTAGSFAQLVVWRFLQGTGAGLFTTAAMVAMADLGGPIHRGRALSVFSGAFLIGSSLGPSIGGIVTGQWGPRAPFLVYAGLAALCLAWVHLQVPETAPARAPFPERDMLESAPRPFPYVDFALVGLVTFAVFFTRAGGRATILPLFAYNQLGATATQVGVLLSALAIMNMIVLYPTGALTDRFGRKVAIVPSIWLMALAFILMSRATSYSGLLAGTVLLGIGSGVGGPAPAAYVADLGPPSRMGAAMGLYRAIGDLGFFAGPIAMGWVADSFGYPAALAGIGGLLTVAVLPFALVAREHRDASGTSQTQRAFAGEPQQAPAAAADE
jgi:MFS transporter, DHA1 family, multidrug resistance protein